MEALKAENSKLKKDLISTMDEANTIKEKVKVLGDDLKAERQLTLEKDEQLQVAKKKVKTVAAKVVEAFQQTEEDNTVQSDLDHSSGKLLMQSNLNHSDPGLQRHRSLSPRSSSFFQRNPRFPSFSLH